ncbi:MAG TPA: hypothetical protein VGE47_11580 [Burkholderiaceae bacterium]
MTLRAALNFALTACLLALALPTPPARADEAAKPAEARRPQTVALIAALGDQMSFVKKRSAKAGSIEPFSRRTVQIDNQLLNYSVLRGLDSALEQEEPESKRVMLRWRGSDELTEQIKNAQAKDLDELMLEALRKQLAQVPQRAEWDRIEAVVPHYSAVERDGMPRRIGGVGVYVKPVGQEWFVEDEEGVDRTNEYKEEGEKTVDPKTGAHGKDTAFVAPYVYFDRVTLDAKTLAVLARKSQYANTKYADPNNKSMDVVAGISPAELVSHLSSLVERAAYQSVRGKVDVEVGPVKQLPASPGSAKP